MTTNTKFDAGTPGANPFEDLTTMFEKFQVPGLDASSYVNARRKDVEALVEANKATYEAMQALARTQADMLTQAMLGMQKSASGSAGVFDPIKQAESARDVWQKMLADMKSLAEMAQKSQVDAVAGLTARAKESAAEIQQAALPK